MGKEIKIRLLKLDKKQVDLLRELPKYGYNIDKSQLSSYINGRIKGPQATGVLEKINDILCKWEKN